MTPAAGTVRLERLKTIPLFAGLPLRALQRIARMMQEFEVPAGRVLVQPRLPGSGLFIIEEGTVTIKSPRVDLERGAGECIGELALLTDRGHGARVKAKTPVRGFAITRSDFQKMLEEEPKIAITLLGIVSTRLSDSLR